MKVVHVSRCDCGDGASNAAHGLHKGLLGLGIDSTMYVAAIRNEREDRSVILFRPRGDLPGRFQRRLRRMQLARSLARYRTSRPAGYEAFSDDRSPYGIELLEQLPEADVVHIHSMYHFIDYRTFFAAVPKRSVLVRTMHDMNFFTGGCHIAAGCERYTERCGACPQLGSPREDDLSRQIWERKRHALVNVAQRRVHVVAPSRWLANAAMRSSLLRDFSISVIPLGVDTEVFRPRDKGFAREVLGIARDARVLLFVAEPITRPVKQFNMLIEAVNGLGGLGNLLLVSVGSGKPQAAIQVPYIALGWIGNERLLSLVYSAADILVLPSLQESFGLVALEAMACGTPVVGTPVGGMPEMVRSGLTGSLSPVDDMTALRTAIREMLVNPARLAAMSGNCRRVAIEEYSLETCVKRYVQFYGQSSLDASPRSH